MMVDLEDFVIMRGNFGLNSPTSAPSEFDEVTNPTPEPASLLLLGAAATVVLKRERKYR